jgi:hypothetical protein
LYFISYHLFHSQAQNLLQAGEEKLVDFSHPDPYCMCWMPGGSKFMRNPPPPSEITGDHDTPYINIDFTPIDWDGKKDTIRDSLVVDFGSKSQY